MMRDLFAKKIKSDWDYSLMVCRKCTKRQKGGFGKKGKSPLAKMLRKALGAKKGRKSNIGVVEVGCLGVCPRHAVVMIDSRAPQEWMLVTPGADVDALAREISGGA